MSCDDYSATFGIGGSCLKQLISPSLGSQRAGRQALICGIRLRERAGILPPPKPGPWTLNIGIEHRTAGNTGVVETEYGLNRRMNHTSRGRVVYGHGLRAVAGAGSELASGTDGGRVGVSVHLPFAYRSFRGLDARCQSSQPGLWLAKRVVKIDDRYGFMGLFQKGCARRGLVPWT